MNSKAIFTSLILLFIISTVFSQSNGQNKYHEFFGTVTASGKKAENVLVKAFDQDTCFSNFRTGANGKFIFSGEAEGYFVLQFEKEGYVTKKIVVNTQNTGHIKKKIKKYKFNVNLARKKKDVVYDYNVSPVAIIEINGAEEEFKSKRYNRTKRSALSMNANDSSAW